MPWIRAIIANVTGPTVITPVSSEAPLSIKLGVYALNDRSGCHCTRFTSHNDRLLSRFKSVAYQTNLLLEAFPFASLQDGDRDGAFDRAYPHRPALPLLPSMTHFSGQRECFKSTSHFYDFTLSHFALINWFHLFSFTTSWLPIRVAARIKEEIQGILKTCQIPT